MPTYFILTDLFLSNCVSTEICHTNNIHSISLALNDSGKQLSKVYIYSLYMVMKTSERNIHLQLVPNSAGN